MTIPADESEGLFDVVLPLSPYPGLRPFEQHEWPIFFGRERMVDEVVDRLLRQQFLVVHGDSGCGKSSLIRAGVLARLEQDTARGGMTWRTCATQPREAPLQLLAEALAALDRRPDQHDRIVEIRRVLNFGADAPGELVRLLRRGPTDHICVLIDQFEELFAFARRDGAEDAKLLVQLLVSLLESPPAGLYVVVTMRSEFLGVCAQFPGLAEAVNRSQYLLPRMGHADLVRAIREPAPLYRGHVSADLAQRLIADAGGTQDQLPLIQHGLMVLYRAAPVQPDGSWRLERAAYDPRHGLAEMLSVHADAVAVAAEPVPHPIVAQVLRALTEINAEGQAIRRPQTFGALAAVAGGDEARLREVLGPFRGENASFLRPYGDARIDRGTLIDISHEALIRSWARVADPREGWLAVEFQDGLIWKSLLVQAESFERDPSSVLSASLAHDRAAWLEHRNAAWAERYGGGWDRVVRLIEASVAAARNAALAEERRKKRRLMLVSAIAALLASVLVVVAFYSQRARVALEQAQSFSAMALWNTLDFSESEMTPTELNALWSIASDEGPLRLKFRDQMWLLREAPLKFGKRPALVARAIELRWPSARARETLDHIVARVAESNDDDELEALAAAGRTVALWLDRQDARQALESIRRTLPQRTSDQQDALSLIVGTVGQALPPEDASQALTMLVTTALKRGYEREPLEQAIASAAQNAPEAQAHSEIQRFLPLLNVAAAVDDIRLAKAFIPVLAPRLTETDAASTLRQLLDMLATAEKDTDDDDRLDEPSESIPSVAGRTSSETAHAALVPLIERIATTKNDAFIPGATKVGIALAQRLSPDRARVDLQAVLRIIERGDHLDDVSSIGAALADRLGPEHTAALLPMVIDQVLRTNDPDQLASLGVLVRPIVGTLPASTIQAAAPRLLAALMNTVGGEGRETAAAARRVADTVESDTAALVLEQSRAALLRATIHDKNPRARDAVRAKITALRGALEGAAGRLDETAAQSELTALLTQLKQAPLAHRGALASAAARIAGAASPGQANDAFRALLMLIVLPDGEQAFNEVADARRDLGRAAGEFARRLTPQQAEAAFDVVFDRIEHAASPEVAAAFVPSLIVLEAHSTPDRARSMMVRIIDRLGDAREGEAELLTGAAETLAPRVPLEDVTHQFDDVVEANADELEREELLRGRVAAALGRRLPGPEAAAKVRALLNRAADQASLADVIVFGALADKLGPTEAREVFPRLVMTVAGANGDKTAQFAPAAMALTARLAPDERTAAVGRILRELAINADPDEADEVLAFEAAVRDATASWTSERAVDLFRSLLGWSSSDDEAMLWAAAFVSRLPRQPVEPAVLAIADALKLPTAVDRAGDVLLDALRAVSPLAPGKTAGLPANLSWIAAMYPSIDLDAPAACPTPVVAELTCPATVASLRASKGP